MEGTIGSVENHGSIVIVWLEIDGAEHPVYFDRRAFFTMAEAEQAESPDDFILIFDSCASDFDVSPLVIGRGSGGV